MTSRRTVSLLMPIAMFGVATFFYLYEFLVRVSPNVLENELILAFNLDAKMFGFFSSCWYWAYAPLQLPVGALTDKYGPRRLLTFAILICAASTLALAYTTSFYLGCMMRFMIGAGSAFAFISCMKIIHIWFSHHLFPLMTGLTLTIGTLGAAAGGIPLSLALDFMSWRQVLIYLGFVGIVLAILAFLLIKDHNPDHPHVSMKKEDTPGFWQCLKEVVKQPQSWFVGIYCFFVTAPTDAFGGTWGVKFLVDTHGISRDVASTAAVTMTFVGMAVGSPLLGWISSIFDNRKIPMMVASLIAAISLTLIVFLPHLTGFSASVLFFMFGSFGTYVLAFVMTRRFSQPTYVATAVGFVNMVSMFGSGILTYMVGWLLDAVSSGQLAENGERIYTTSDYHLSLIVLPIFYAISAFIVVPLIRDGKD
ncbi:MAG: MFS transporter [Gammaproteobacteria bacterium]|nr:MFS transporter [Gammaproteobacteria bacterium]